MLNFGTLVNDVSRYTTTIHTGLVRLLEEIRTRANTRDFLHRSGLRFQVPPGMEIVQAEHRGDNHGAIHNVEV